MSHESACAKERVLSTADELSDDVKQAGLASLTNLFLSDDLAHSTTYGPDCAGVSTVRAVVHGGKLLIAVDALQLLSFYQCLGIIVQIEKGSGDRGSEFEIRSIPSSHQQSRLGI